MDATDETWTDDIDARREMIRQSLDAIANDVGMALRDAGLRFPVYLTVPNGGDALATFATPLDPSDDDWATASASSPGSSQRYWETYRYGTGAKNVRWRELR